MTARPDPKPPLEAPPAGDAWALALLRDLRDRQAGLPFGAALAWERAGFAEALARPEPRARIRAFLGGK